MRAVVEGGEREDREQAVADELQHLAVMGDDRADHLFEIGVQQRRDVGAGQPVGQVGEPAQVGDPDDGAGRLAGASLDRAAEDLRPGNRPEIGVQHVAGDAQHDVPLHVQGEQPEHACQRRDVILGKTSRLPGRRRRRVVIGPAADGEGEILGDALRRQLRHQRHIADEFRVLRVAAHRLSSFDDPVERVAPIGVGAAHLLRHLDLVAQPVVEVPVPGEADELGVQRTDMQARPVERQTGGDHAPVQRFEQRQQVGLAHGVAQKPGLDVVDRGVRGRRVWPPVRAPHQRHRGGI